MHTRIVALRFVLVRATILACRLQFTCEQRLPSRLASQAVMQAQEPVPVSSRTVRWPVPTDLPTFGTLSGCLHSCGGLWHAADGQAGPDYYHLPKEAVVRDAVEAARGACLHLPCVVLWLGEAEAVMVHFEGDRLYTQDRSAAGERLNCEMALLQAFLRRRPGLSETWLTWMDKLFEIIHEDAQLLVINKPAGLVCHPTKGDAHSSLIGRVRLHLGADARPHLVNRLDRETSGVTMVAKTDAAARSLRKIWESRAVEKEYSAIVHGWVVEAARRHQRAVGARCVQPRRHQGLRVRGRGGGAGRILRLSGGSPGPRGNSACSRCGHTRDASIKIRIHLTHAGHPIVGDKLYGGDEDLYLALVEDRLTEQQRKTLILLPPCPACARSAF